MSPRFIDHTGYTPVENNSWGDSGVSIPRARSASDDPGRGGEDPGVASAYPLNYSIGRYTEGRPDSSHIVTVLSLRTKRLFCLQWWWWWEIGGSLLSIISVGLLIPVLTLVDNKPIEAWPYSIRPNSCISVLTTIAKTAMMVPISSCLGQLKWDHFQYHPNPLDHLRFYDDASRGPWGSFVLIASGRLRVVTAWALAIVSLLALGIEPSAQQILEPLSRQALLLNITGKIGRAQNYTSRATAIADGIVGSVSDVDFYCPQPATRCTWPPFTTLSVCSDFSNLTNIIKPNCITHATGSKICTYNFPGEEGSVSINRDDNLRRDTVFNSTGYVNFPSGDEILPRCILNVVKQDDEQDFQAFSINWSYCLKTFHTVVASPAGILEAQYTSEPITGYANLSSSRTGYLDHFIVNSTDEIFKLNLPVQAGLWMHLSDMLSRNVSSRLLGHSPAAAFSVGEFMLYTDLKIMTRDIEETLSNQIRSSALGDNVRAEMWPGQAFYEETYWHPLFKSSAIALLYHGLDYVDVGMALRDDEQRSMEDLEYMVESIDVAFRRDADGVLKFVRVGRKG
ncbi:hypothetical protein F5Y10DRAFT_288501 [Nemania abortiva]|nr:hypothetical protein F5Y10DRAFT_288501 [Nemania abortiva]